MMIWVDGSSMRCFSRVERAIIEVGDESQEKRVIDIGRLNNLGRRGGRGRGHEKGWSTFLAQFSNFLGMSTKGFKEKILALLKKNEDEKDVEGFDG